MTQNQTVLDHFKRSKTLTAKQAYERYGIMRLAARIHDLAKQGHWIHTDMVQMKTRNGKTRVAKYYYLGLTE